MAAHKATKNHLLIDKRGDNYHQSCYFADYMNETII